MDIDPFNFADSMIGVLAQRLVRTLCPECRQAHPADDRELAGLARDYGEEEFARLGVAAGATLQRAVGCAACGGTGYRGRIPLHELLDASPAIKRLVRRGANAEELYQQARQEGMTTLLQDGIRKVLAGHTDMSRVRAVCSR
jgi:type II secretory ATPase GspE/PulE/Tfp pilus assembly ATPase PilB-like protein